MNILEKLFEDKLLVVPDYVKSKVDGRVVKYRANAIHLISNEVETLPYEKVSKLYMPYSATKDKKLLLNKEKPEIVEVELGKTPISNFTIAPITKTTKFEHLDPIAKRIVSKDGSFVDEKDNVEVPLCFYLRLPMVENDSVLKREHDYKSVVSALARDVYDKYYNMQVKAIARKLGNNMDGYYEPTKEQKQQIDESFAKFIGKVDAVEIGYNPNSAVIAGYSDLDRDTNYETYTVVLYRFVEKNKEDRNIKEAVLDCVENRKNEIATEIAESKAF